MRNRCTRLVLAAGAVAAVVMATPASPAAAADSDWTVAWQGQLPGTYDEGAFVYSYYSSVDQMLSSSWYTSSLDLTFAAAFDVATLTQSGSTQPVSPFGVGSSTAYGQTVRALQGATSLDHMSFTLSHIDGVGPYVVRPFVLPWDSAHEKPSAVGAWIGTPISLTGLTDQPSVFTVDLPNVPVTQGDTYVIGLTTLMDSVGAGSDDPQPVVYEAVGRSTGCEPRHGWTPSWQEWANNGTGGPVCTRTLMWTSTQGWLPAAVDPQTNRYAPIPDATR